MDITQLYPLDLLVLFSSCSIIVKIVYPFCFIATHKLNVFVATPKPCQALNITNYCIPTVHGRETCIHTVLLTTYDGNPT